MVLRGLAALLIKQIGSFNMSEIEKISGGFKPGQNPAAEFGKGATSIAEIQKSADAVREHSAELGNRPTGPKRTPIKIGRGHDALNPRLLPRAL